LPFPPLDLEVFLPYRLAVLAHDVSRALASVYGDRFGLTIAEWRLIANLGRFGPLYAGDLAARSNLEKPKVTRALRRLLAARLITRTTDRDDRRTVRIALTAKGSAIFAEIGALALDWEAQLLAPLSVNEHKALDRILGKLAMRAATMGDATSLETAHDEAL
jgi:DNA-binding MarR family transcriptional regulator